VVRFVQRTAGDPASMCRSLQRTPTALAKRRVDVIPSHDRGEGGPMKAEEAAKTHPGSILACASQVSRAAVEP
jgi:hypothetical protein